MSDRIFSRRRTALCVLLLAVLAIAYFSPLLLSERCFAARDHYIFFHPRRFFAAEQMRAGHLPLWNPYLAGGVPFLANLQSSVVYPLAFLYYVMPFSSGYTWYVILHYWLGSLFMFVLLRRWGLSHSGALLGGMVFAYGGYLTSINDYLAFLTAGIWLPLVLCAYQTALDRRSWLWALLTGVVIGLQILAGDASYTLLVTGWAMLGQLLIARQRWWQIGGRDILRMLLAWAAGFGCAAVVLVPFAELVLHSTRWQSGLSYDVITRWSLHPAELLQWLVPFVYGTLVPNIRWFGQAWLDTIYVGIVPLLLAVLAVITTQERRRWYLLGLLVVGISIALGRYSPVFAVSSKVIPGISLLQIPVKFMALAGFSLAALAGMGWDCLRVRLVSSCRDYVLPGLAVAAGIAAVGLILLSQTALPALWHVVHPVESSPSATLPESLEALWQGVYTAASLLVLTAGLLWMAWRRSLAVSLSRAILFAVVVIDLALIGRPQYPGLPYDAYTAPNPVAERIKQEGDLVRIYAPDTFPAKRHFMHYSGYSFDRTYTLLRAALRPNLNMYAHIQGLGEYAALYNSRYYDLFLPIEQSFKADQLPVLTDTERARLLSLLNVGYLVSYAPLQVEGFELVSDEWVYLYRNRAVLPRAFFVDELGVADRDEDVVAYMLHRQWDPRRTAFALREVGRRIRPLVGEGPTNALPHERQASIVAYAPQRVVIRAEAGQAALLVLADTYYPGWEATVNGRPVAIERVNHTLRGVPVPSEASTIEMAYRPRSVMIGAALTILTMLTILVIVLVYAVRLKKRGCGRGAR